MVSSGSSSKYMIVFWCVKDFSRILVCRCHSFSFSSLLLCIYFHLYPLSSSPSLLSIHRTLGQRRGSWVCSFFFFFFNFILFFNFTILYWFCHISKWICHRLDFTPWNPLSGEAESHKGSSPEDYQIPCLERISRARHPFCKWGHWGSEKGHNVLKKMQLNN